MALQPGACHSMRAVTPAALCPQPWRLEVVRETHIAPGSAKIRASLRPGVVRQLPELLLAGSEVRRGRLACDLRGAYVCL